MSDKTSTTEFIATGRRKTSSARVRIKEGTGIFLINGKNYSDYCSTEEFRKIVLSPLATVELVDGVDITVNVKGGGGAGQAGAIRHGLSRALEKMDPELRVPLKKEGHMRRDPRKLERKKPGQPGARKRFQFSKR
ncbi:MAG: 30S ribosomal protein S9 [Opitutales bacterium]|jgi:small subunit ribosomal protein S9|tara:strand:- start:443 stop:847 length:405 start_codon:yes stop_codon:yes gene_type:complete